MKPAPLETTVTIAGREYKVTNWEVQTQTKAGGSGRKPPPPIALSFEGEYEIVPEIGDRLASLTREQLAALLVYITRKLTGVV